MAVDVFVILSAWFLCDKRIHLIKPISAWITTFIYSAILGLVYLVLNKDILYFIKHLLPVSTEVVWFMSAYIVLLLIAPVLNLILENRKMERYIILFSILFVAIPTFLPSSTFKLSYIGWFVLLYLITGILKHNESQIMKIPHWILVLVFLVCFEANILNYLLFDRFELYARVGNALGWSKGVFFARIDTIPAVGSSFALFFLFKNIKIISKKVCSVILLLSGMTFDVYVLLAMNCPEGYLFWVDLLGIKSGLNIFSIYLVCVGAFFCAGAISFVRNAIVDKLTMRIAASRCYVRLDSLFFYPQNRDISQLNNEDKLLC